MKRISTPTKVADKFGQGKHGFRDGDAVNGVVATDLEADLFDHIQEELCALVEAGGGAVDGSARNQVLTALNAMYKTGRLIGVQVFTANGTYTPTPGTQFIIADVQGAGGGGGGTSNTGAGQTAVGGGGASGSYGRGRFTAAQIGASQSVTVGTGGAGGVIGANGSTGGMSSFGALLSAPGGGGGAAGVPAVAPNMTTYGVPGSAATGGDILSTPGAPGGFGLSVGSGLLSGAGANSPLTGGGGGRSSGVASNGFAGTCGGGGSGGGSGVSSAGMGGGAGGNGLVIIYEYA